jgi:hypothetical protein
MVETLESNIFCYRASYSIQIKLKLKDTVNNTPSNLDRVGEPRFYNIGGTTLRLLPVVVNHHIGLVVSDNNHRISSNIDTPYQRHRPPYQRHGIALSPHRPSYNTASPHHIELLHTVSTSESAVRHSIMSQKEIVDAVLLLRDDHRVADVWHSPDTIATILNVPTMTLNKALSKSPEFTHIDVQGSANRCGVVRFKWQLYLLANGVEKNVSRHFLFFPHRKKPVFYKESNTWSEIYTKSAHLKLAPRSQSARTVTPPTPINHDDGPASFLLSPSPPRKKRHDNLSPMQYLQKDLTSSMTREQRHCSTSLIEVLWKIA